jgi:predicted amino acid dehydrogenase
MRRTQIYITEDQDRRLTALAGDRHVAKAVVIRQILDAALETGDAEAEARAAIVATAGICADAPDWPEWQRDARGRTADQRLRDVEL